MSPPMVELVAYTEDDVGDVVVERFLRRFDVDFRAIAWFGEVAAFD
jgi:hypothetical protein